MEIGYQVMAWRRAQGLTQGTLAVRSNLSRPYLSRLERGVVDPALSTLRRLAAALEIPLGRFLEEAPPAKSFTRDELDNLARSALRPGTRGAQNIPSARALARFFHGRRRALGLYTERKSRSNLKRPSGGKHAARWLRAAVGEDQWQALLRRIDKLASLYASSP